MAEKKKVGFFEKVVTGLTGKTAEQRQADALLKNQIQQKQLASYRAEQLARAEDVGKARADWEAKQQIANVGKPKPLFNIDIGEFGKQKEGFDINNVFGTGGASAFGGAGTPAHQKVKGKIREMHKTAPKLFSVADAINYGTASGLGGSWGSSGVSRVRGKLRKHRIKKHAKKHHKGKAKGSGRQSFTITMNK